MDLLDSNHTRAPASTHLQRVGAICCSESCRTFCEQDLKSLRERSLVDSGRWRLHNRDCVAVWCRRPHPHTYWQRGGDHARGRESVCTGPADRPFLTLGGRAGRCFRSPRQSVGLVCRPASLDQRCSRRGGDILTEDGAPPVHLRRNRSHQRCSAHWLDIARRVRARGR